MNYILEPWPWFVTGPLIGMMVPMMLILGSRFGVSGNLESFCNLMGADKLSDYFKFDMTTRIPGLLFVLGSIIGGFLAFNFLSNDVYEMALSIAAVELMESLGISNHSGMQPEEVFNWNFLLSWQGMLMLCLGGFLIGFGTRYAGGCTSGHSITGLSSLSPTSLIATVGFFIGGLISSHLLIPLILAP